MKAANWLTHLELDWESPIWGHWLHGLAEHRQLIRYDERGCGLSDWDVADFSFDAWVDDLELVVDSLGVDRFPLLGVSQGGAVAIAYAVRHPERVEKLILPVRRSGRPCGRKPRTNATRPPSISTSCRSDGGATTTPSAWFPPASSFRRHP